ncbi:MAG: tetratricopeptide repeat protein [Elusimicrobiota bacterium]
MKRHTFLISILFFSAGIVFSAAEKAPDTIESLLQVLPKTAKKRERIEIYLKLADLYVQKADRKNAVESYRKALEDRPPKKSAYAIWMLIGDMYLLDSQYAQAIESYQEAVDLAPLAEDARLKLASAYEQSDLQELARGEYLSILATHRKSFSANYALAQLYLKQNLNSQAMDYFRKTLTIKPETKVYRQIALCAGNLGDTEIAIAMLKRVISTEENYGDFLNLGSLYQSGKKVSEAEDMFSRAVKLDPSKPDAYIYLGVLYLGNKDLTPAEKMFQIALEKLPGEALLHFFLANIYFQQNNVAAAKAEIRRAESLSKTRMISVYSGKFGKFLNAQQ